MTCAPLAPSSTREPEKMIHDAGRASLGRMEGVEEARGDDQRLDMMIVDDASVPMDVPDETPKFGTGLPPLSKMIRKSFRRRPSSDRPRRLGPGGLWVLSAALSCYATLHQVWVGRHVWRNGRDSTPLVMDTSHRPQLPKPTDTSRQISTDPVDDDDDELPQVVWLASYPNSGTSYTLTMVERSTNLSIASNYGPEVTPEHGTSIPIHTHHPEGPYWEGLSGAMNTTIRHLPATFVLTKTHCGGRCVRCPRPEFVVNITTFMAACQRTTRLETGQEMVVEDRMAAHRVKRLVHLIRHPFHNVVARFHLDRRHELKKARTTEQELPYNATGFEKWCRHMDALAAVEDSSSSSSSLDQQQLMPEEWARLYEAIPYCRAEFYKYLQWHNRLQESVVYWGGGQSPIPVLVVYYEDYETRLNETVQEIMDFLQLQVVSPVRPFRSLPTYADHFTAAHRRAVYNLARAMSSPATWSLLQHYFEEEEIRAAESHRAVN